MKTLKSCPLRPATDHGKKFVYIEELPESDHCIFYCESQDPGKKFRMGKLMGEGSSETPVFCPMVPTPKSQGTSSHSLALGTRALGCPLRARHCELPRQR